MHSVRCTCRIERELVLLLNPSPLPPHFPSSTPPFLPRSYTFTTNAFAAQLTSSQVRRLQQHQHVAYVQRDRVVTTQETYAPQFINVKSAMWPAAGGQSNAGQGIIIGIIDTGIWPEHPSFSNVSGGLRSDVMFGRVCEHRNVRVRFISLAQAHHCDGASLNLERECVASSPS